MIIMSTKSSKSFIVVVSFWFLVDTGPHEETHWKTWPAKTALPHEDACMANAETCGPNFDLTFGEGHISYIFGGFILGTAWKQLVGFYLEKVHLVLSSLSWRISDFNIFQPSKWSINMAKHQCFNWNFPNIQTSSYIWTATMLDPHLQPSRTVPSAGS